MKLTAVFEPAKEGGYTCFVEEIPGAISQGETIQEAKASLGTRLNRWCGASASLRKKVFPHSQGAR
jgi:hypothetical protein